MHRTSSKVLLIVAAFALFLVPVAAIAAGGFTDVEDDSVFKADIEWLADAGVTKGCNPPTNDKFCPGSNVTREQMSAFMHRLATNKVVDAATAVNAANADMLDGVDSSGFATIGDLEGKADKPYLSLITYIGTTSGTPSGFEALRDLGSFTKNADDTVVMLTWQSHVTMSEAGVSCAFQLRIANLNSKGGTGFVGTEVIINSSERNPASVIDVFSGLDAGSYTVSLWARGLGSPTCVDNSGNYTRSVIIEEIHAEGGTITPLSAATAGATNDS